MREEDSIWAPVVIVAGLKQQLHIGAFCDLSARSSICGGRPDAAARRHEHIEPTRPIISVSHVAPDFGLRFCGVAEAFTIAR